MESEHQLEACSDSISHFHEAVKSFNAENDGDLFLIASKEILEGRQEDVLFDVLVAPENRKLLDFVGWDLIKIVFQFLPEDCINSLNFETHNKLLTHICSSCNSREIILSLSELLSYELTWQKLVILLRLLRLTCVRLVGNISNIITSILESLQTCLQNENNIFEHGDVLGATLEFVSLLVEKSQGTPSDIPKDKLKERLLSFLIELLEHPFILLEFGMDFEMQNEQEPLEQAKRNYKFAKNVIQMLSVLENGCLKQLFEYGIRQQSKIYKTVKVDTDSKDLSYVGLGCLSFLTHVAMMGEQFIPSVTTGKYSLDTNMVYINALLCVNGVKAVSKGVTLLSAILNMIKANTLDHNYLDNKELTQLLHNLRKLMIHYNDSLIRQDCVKAFKKIVHIFTHRGKYRLLRSLYQGEIQPGFAELLNLILKEEIATSLQNASENPWFIGHNLASFLLDDIFKVPPKAMQSEFGVIEESNRILSTLNLIRFLLIRDCTNKTTIHTVFPQINGAYLKKLREVVKFSEARITILIKENEEEIRRGVSKQQTDASILSVRTIHGCELEHGTSKERLEVLQSSLLTLDMIESILARIGEITTEK